MSVTIELGLGIIGLGKPWGHIPSDVPTEREAIELLEFAFETGIRYFDSAPSYGVAEERLGKFLRSLAPEQRKQVRIATKFGEHWDANRSQPFVDHSYDALCRSLGNSLRHLGRVDVLQLHKTTLEALRSAALHQAWDYAMQMGIPMLGASVSDLESANIVIDEPRHTCIQLPFNCVNTKFAIAVQDAAARDMWIATNRPLAMGEMLYRDAPISTAEAFHFLLKQKFHGVILTGTKSKRHLEENWQAFASCL